MAATGTPTPNIGLRCPVGTDPASVDDINYNSGVIDTKLGAVGSTSVQAQIDALNSNIGNKKYRSGIAEISIATTDWTDWGGLKLASKSVDISFGITFSTVNAIIITPIVSNSSNAMISGCGYSASKITSIDFVRPNATSGTIKVSWLAIGT